MNPMLCKTLLPLSLFVASLPLQLNAQSVEAVADTYVKLGGTSADTIYGTNTTIETANDGGTFGLPKTDDRYSLIRFDLTAFTTPFTAGSVSLNLEKTAGPAADFVVFGIADLGADEFFDETTYTFNTSAYAITTNGGAVTEGGLNKANLLELGTFSSTLTSESISFSSTALVDFLNDDTNNMAAFIIYQSTQNKTTRSFASREHATLDGPMLVAIPEPSTFALLGGLGALFAAATRRRGRSAQA